MTLPATPEPTRVPVPPPKPMARGHYRALQPERIVDTAEQLVKRVAERFPTAGLLAVAEEIRAVASEAAARTERIRQPNYGLRLGVAALIASLLGLLTAIGVNVDGLASDELFQFEHFVQSLEAALGSMVFLGAAIAFLVTLEGRWKRVRLLAALRELRALAHVVDMHQLTKDPQSLTQNRPTESSPKRTMTTFELGRYLDYCSEMLSVIAKIAAIYVQEFPDPTAVEAADQVATLTNDLSGHVWQKIRMLERGETR